MRASVTLWVGLGLLSVSGLAGLPVAQAFAAGGTVATIAAPTPDPFIAQIYKACALAASGSSDVAQKMANDGWNPVVEADTQTPLYQAFDGEKDFPGVGTVSMTFSTEVWPSVTQGYCTTSIDNAERRIGIGDLAKMPGLRGLVRDTSARTTGTWEEDAAAPSFFVQADQSKDDLFFVLDITRMVNKPAVDIPYVAPPPGSGSDEPADPGTSPDTNT